MCSDSTSLSNHDKNKFYTKQALGNENMKEHIQSWRQPIEPPTTQSDPSN